jgi:hypothetical protein
MVLSFIRPCLACLFGPTPGRMWRKKVHRTLATAYATRVFGEREDNIEHEIHHLTKALENVSVEGPGSTTERFGKRPADGNAGNWSELMSHLSSTYRARVKVSWLMVNSVCQLDGVLPLSV